jgi:probable addiction module antidote protein
MTTMAIKTRVFDAAVYLDNEEAIAEYLTAALETGDASFIADALGVVARAKGMTRIAEEAGLGRESLYKSLREGANPELATVLRVIRALGLRLTAAPAAHEQSG